MKKRNLIFALLSFLNVIVLAQTCPPGANYEFSGNANDISGNNLHGVNNGATLTSDRDGNSNEAYSFNGTSNYIELNNNSPVITTTNFSIETWARVDGVGGGADVQNPVFIQRPDATGSGVGGSVGFHLENSSGNISFGMRGNTGSSSQSIQYPKMPYGEYHHYVGVKESNSIKLYVDGVLVVSSSYTPDGNYTALIDYVMIGKNRYLGFDAGFFNGVIDFVKIYDCSLSASDVQDLYQVTCNPVAEYDFNGNTNDISGNNLHGVNNGATLTNDRLGNPNQAYYFNGSSSFIELNNNNPVVTTTVFSIETWARVDGVGGGADVQNPLFIQRPDATGSGVGGSIGFLLENSAGNISFGMRGNTGSSSQAIQYPKMPYGEYHHYVGVKESNAIKLYVDGALVISSSYTPDGNYTSLIDYVMIGKNRYLGFDAGFFNGVVDFVKIHDCALDASEVLDLATVSINEYESENSLIQIYPNPSNGIITLTDVENKGIEKFSIYDITGKLVPFTSSNNTINLGNVIKGIYFLNVEFKDGSQAVSKIIVE